MIDFIKKVKIVLEEQGKTTEDLFNDKIISEDTFYKYKHRDPSLKTVIKIANYLHVTVDYLLELSDENHFRLYTKNQEGFYDIVTPLIDSSGFSRRQFCKEVDIARDSICRWRKGSFSNIQTLIDMAKFFKCPVDDLLEKEKSVTDY